jgi:carboxymethylenebutenolidase
VLTLYGGEDAGIPAESRDAFHRALDVAGVEHRSIVYEGAPHSFFDRKAAEFAEASADAWRQMLEFMEIPT